MRELDCGCGYHLGGSEERCLGIKVLLHLEAAHPEIEEPTIELAEELVVAEAYEPRPTKLAGVPCLGAPALNHRAL